MNQTKKAPGDGMSFAHDLQAVPQDPRLEHKRMTEILEVLTEEERDVLIEVLRDTTIPASHIARVLRTYGHGVGETTLRNYRRAMLAGEL